MKPWRSFLFIPGHRERMLAKGPTTDADALLFDFEDAVPAGEKERARATVAEFIPTLTRQPAFVRINGPGSGDARADMEAVVGPHLSGLFVPKVETGDEVRELAAWLDELEGATGTSAGQVELVCMIETAPGLRLAYEIAVASDRVASLCCSSAENGDLQTDLGCEWSPEGIEFLYARSKIVADTRAAGRWHPLDGVYARIDDLEGLAADTLLSRRLGYKGRAIIHPSHIETTNRIYTPSVETIEYCRGLLAAFESALAAGNAAVEYEGKMIDYAMATWARRVLEQGELLGLTSTGP
jgi:citrate lyase subunit beta / citryl-CoA lyase